MKPLHLPVLICALFFLSGCAEKDSFDKPNIILVFVDDLGYEVIDDPDNLYHTPNVDSLKSWGMSFSNAHATPLCTPSRVQALTGKYGHKNYIGFGLLDPRETTFADLLKKAGYATATAGKWQLFGNRQQREIAKRRGAFPQEVGFDQSALWQVTEKNGSRFKDPWIVINEEQDRQFVGRFGPDLFSDYIDGFIDRPRDSPFLIYYPMVLTHDPFQPVPGSEGFEEFDSNSGLNDPIWFADNVAYMDKLVGRLTSSLIRTGLMGSTLILFVGDNGTDRAVTSEFSSGPITGNKGFTNVYGTHVPLIAVWPEEISGASMNENLVDLSDILPTFAEAAGVNISDSLDIDGISILDQLRGKDDAAVRKSIYTYYAPNWGVFEHKSWAHTEERKYYSDGSYYFIDRDPEEKMAVPFDELDSSELETYNYLKSEVELRPIPSPKTY